MTTIHTQNGQKIRRKKRDCNKRKVNEWKYAIANQYYFSVNYSITRLNKKWLLFSHCAHTSLSRLLFFFAQIFFLAFIVCFFLKHINSSAYSLNFLLYQLRRKYLNFNCRMHWKHSKVQINTCLLCVIFFCCLLFSWLLWMVGWWW